MHADLTGFRHERRHDQDTATCVFWCIAPYVIAPSVFQLHWLPSEDKAVKNHHVPIYVMHVGVIFLTCDTRTCTQRESGQRAGASRAWV